MNSIDKDIIFDLVFNKKNNLYISGIGGVGKSYQLKRIYDEAKNTKLNVFLTSSTGVSSFLIGGTTIHSWAGITLPSFIQDEEGFKNFILKSIKKIKNNSSTLERWLYTDLLLIDEISMLGCNYVDLLNCIGKSIRENNKPFGGIQLILSGDMLQLPPVKDGFVFESLFWEEANLVYISLKKAWRFNDQNFIDLLQRIRLSQHTSSDIKCLQSRLISNFKPSEYEDAVHIFPLKKDVDEYNRNKLEQIKSLTIIIQSKDSCKKLNKEESKNENEDNNVKDFDSIFTCPKNLHIKINCNVMLLVNLNVEKGLVNGSVGKVVDLKYDSNNKLTSIEVYFHSIKESFLIEKQQFVYQEYGYEIKRIQFPLILSYAVNTFKIQGSTLEKVVLDLGNNNFAEGQIYVSLSRCRNINGVFIQNLSLNKFRSNLDCLKFEKELNKKAISI